MLSGLSGKFVQFIQSGAADFNPAVAGVFRIRDLLGGGGR